MHVVRKLHFPSTTELLTLIEHRNKFLRYECWSI